jgi:hypothetical protein
MELCRVFSATPHLQTSLACAWTHVTESFSLVTREEEFTASTLKTAPKWRNLVSLKNKKTRRKNLFLQSYTGDISMRPTKKLKEIRRIFCSLDLGTPSSESMMTMTQMQSKVNSVSQKSTDIQAQLISLISIAEVRKQHLPQKMVQLQLWITTHINS